MLKSGSREGSVTHQREGGKAWAAPCGLWELPLQLGRGPGQRWMEEAGRRLLGVAGPGARRWEGRRGSSLASSLVPPAHMSAAGPTKGSFHQGPENWGAGGLGSFLQSCGETVWPAEPGSRSPLQGHVSSAALKALPVEERRRQAKVSPRAESTMV